MRLCFHLLLIGLASACPDSIIWGSSSSTSVLANTFHNSVQVAKAPFWPDELPGAHWIWESAEKSLGTYVFLELFPLTDKIKDKVDKVTVYIAADDYYSISLNGNSISTTAGQPSDPPASYDLTPYVVYSTTAHPVMNKLKVMATNTGGFAGVMYKVEVTLKG